MKRPLTPALSGQQQPQLSFRICRLTVSRRRTQIVLQGAPLANY